MANAANVSSYVRAIACLNHSLQRLLGKKTVFLLFNFFFLCLNVDCQTFFVSPE